MRKAILLLLALGICALPALGQQSKPPISEQEWESLYTALEGEDWSKAAELSDSYLKKFKQEDEEKSMARLRYILIFASAGRVSERKMTYEELGKILTDAVGKEIVLPARNFSTKSPPGMNAIAVLKEGPHDLSCAASNDKGTNIFAFEYIKLKQKLDRSHDGEVGAVNGTLASFQLNPNRSTIWIMRLFIEKGEVIFGEPKA